MSNIQIEEYFVKKGLLSNFIEDHVRMDKDEIPRNGSGTLYYGGGYRGFMLKANWKNDKKNGAAVLYTDEGVVLADIIFEDDIMCDHCVMYNEEGDEVFDGYVKNGLKEGICKEYDDNRNLCFFGRYSDNERVSTLMLDGSFYRETSIDGRVIAFNQYCANFSCKNGYCIECDDSLLISVIIYKDGKVQYKWKSFTKDMMTEFDEKNSVVYMGSFSNNKEKLYPRNGFGTIFTVGKPPEILIYDDGIVMRSAKQFNGTMMTEYNEQGDVIYLGEYKKNYNQCCPRNGKGIEYITKEKMNISIFKENIVSHVIASIDNQIMTEYDDHNCIVYIGSYRCDSPLTFVRHGIGSEIHDNVPVNHCNWVNGKKAKSIKTFIGNVMTEFNEMGSIVYVGEYENNATHDYPRNGIGREYINDVLMNICVWNNNVLSMKKKSFVSNTMTEYDNMGVVIYIGGYTMAKNTSTINGTITGIEDMIRHGTGCVFVNGNISTVIQYEAGIPVRTIKKVSDNLITEYDKNGKRIYVGEYTNTIMGYYPRQGIGREYLDDKLISIGVYDEGSLEKRLKSFDGETMTEYDDNGERIYEGDYLDNFSLSYPRNGTGKEFEANKCIFVGEYINGKRNGNGRIIKNGRKYCDGTWKNGFILGSIQLYDENGRKVISKGIGVDGLMVDKENRSISLLLQETITKNLKFTIRCLQDFIACSGNVCNLKVANQCCNDRKITSLNLTSFMYLKTLAIGHNCFRCVDTFDAVGMVMLEHIDISYNCFTNAQNSWPKKENTNRVFKLTNCPVLARVFIDSFSFSDYYECIIESIYGKIV